MNEYPQFNDWRATRSLGTGKVGETFEIVRSDSFGTTEQGVLKLIRVPAMRMDAPEQPGLYRDWHAPVERACTLTLIPYFAWANRGEGEMDVWLRI